MRYGGMVWYGTSWTHSSNTSTPNHRESRRVEGCRPTADITLTLLCLLLAVSGVAKLFELTLNVMQPVYSAFGAKQDDGGGTHFPKEPTL